jgi:transcriptional regulator with XRE-family HTH domain
MNGADFKKFRRTAKLTQKQAASRLGLTQAYLSMVESGRRPISPGMVDHVLQVFDLPPTALPMETQATSCKAEGELPAELGALGYPGFAYFRGKPACNPAQLLFRALDQEDLDSRVVEALPWLTYTYADMNWDWLMSNAKLKDRQNRLGYVVALARGLGEKASDAERVEVLAGRLALLERSRLAGEDTLCHDSMTQVERKWLRKNRPRGARHWNLLTDLDVRNLAYASA